MSDLGKISFLTGLKLRGRSSQRGQPPSLGNLFLLLCFDLFHSLGQKSSIFCNVFLTFLSMLFPQGNSPTSVSEDIWMHGVPRRWILGALVLGFLPFLFRGFLTTYGRTSSSLRILLALWGPR